MEITKNKQCSADIWGNCPGRIVGGCPEYSEREMPGWKCPGGFGNFCLAGRVKFSRKKSEIFLRGGNNRGNVPSGLFAGNSPMIQGENVLGNVRWK